MPRIGTRKLYHLIKPALCDAQIKLGRDGLFAYLRNENLLVKPKKIYTKTTYSKHWLKKYANLLKEHKPTRAEEVFVSDITYVKTEQGTHYLSLTTDAYSRRIMGYELSPEMKASDVVKALKMCVNRCLNTLPAMHHSDRGLQYCSSEYLAALHQANMKPSMTDGYDCYQYAQAERINGILKGEFLLYRCKSMKELKKLVEESINIYNKMRSHLSLGMQTPEQVHQKSQPIARLAST